MQNKHVSLRNSLMNDKMLPIASEGTAMTYETEPKSNLSDEHKSPQNEKTREQNIYEEIMRSYESFLAGNTTSVEDADARIRETKEWDEAVYEMAHPVRHAPRDLDINWFE